MNLKRAITSQQDLTKNHSKNGTLNLLPLISLITCALWANIIHAQCPETPPAQQVNMSGWETPNRNVYAWSMTTLQIDSKTYLYVGTNNSTGGEIWRTQVPDQIYGAYSWEKVLDTGSNPQGNSGFRNIVTFKNRIFAGSRNSSGGCQLWRSGPGGEQFMQIVGPRANAVLYEGFGIYQPKPRNISVRGLEVFNGYLYIGLQNNAESPPELWRTSDGSTFEKVSLHPDMANPDNSSIHTMAVRNGKLYIATRNLTAGLQIWSTEDGTNFVSVVGPNGSAAASGFGSVDETTPLDLHEHNGYLFVGTGKPGGFGIYRIEPNDVGWQKIASEGLGDRFAYYAWQFETFDNQLWLGTFNYLPLFFDWARRGAALYKSGDNGESWDLMVGGTRRNPTGECFLFGFGDRQNFGIRSFAVVEDRMYIGTGVCPHPYCTNFDGAEVWAWPCVECQ